MNQGRVTLVGAGPGDGGLLTLRGAQVLAEAQVVLADRLVGPEVLARIPAGAQVVDVGKESGHHTLPQQEINQLLLDFARQGKRVVRLKGGDPYLYGRGGEELEAVAAAGIPFEVVPGVSSAIAAPAYAGIPVTHREYGSSVHILTGHAKGGGEPEIDYQSLTRLGGTLVFLMGFTALERITAGLMDAGMEPERPAALVERGTLPGQRRVTATVGTLAQRVREAGLAAPAVLVVGEVCGLSGTLDWFSRLPLSGKTVLVTRPATADSALADRLAQLGCRVIRYPCIRLEPRATALPKLDGYRWIVFTSAFGAALFFRLLREGERDIRTLAGLRFAVIGERTGEELTKRGMLADYLPPVFDAEHLARGLADRVGPEERVLLFRASAGTAELPDILRERDVAFDDLPAYDTLYESPAAGAVREYLERGEVDYVTFTSASTVEGFVRSLGQEAVRRGGFTGLCIGEQTARGARALGIPVVVSARATLDGMIQAVLEDAEGRGRECK